MKVSQKLVPFLFVTLLLSASCSKEDVSNKLLGEWKLTQATFDTPNLDSAFVSAAKHSLESSIFYFEKDDHFEIEDTSFTGGSYQGTWEYSEETGQLTLFYTSLPIDPEIYDIVKLSGNKMVIRQTQESIGILEYQLERRE